MLKPKRKKQSASTVHQWRTNKALVKAASLTLQNEVFQEMLAVAENASPLKGNQLAFGSHITEGDHARHLGRIEGYSMALETLQSLGTQIGALPKEPEQAYAPEE